MPVMDVLLGRSFSLDEAEEELGKPDRAEAENLALHVDRCGKRWVMSYRASKNNSAQLAQIRLILILLAVYEIAKATSLTQVIASFFR